MLRTTTRSELALGGGTVVLSHICLGLPQSKSLIKPGATKVA